MKFLMIVTFLLVGPAFGLSAFASSHGSEGTGGGDTCEDRIKVIRDDIQLWIRKGGANDLKLPAGMTTDHYAKAMLEQISKSRIACLGKGDAGYPIQIHHTPKVCRFDLAQNRSRIQCDFEKFLALSETDQYVLIHHEYAGLSRIEVPDRDDSHYEVSNQISNDLVDEVVKKLAVKSPDSPKPTSVVQVNGCQFTGQTMMSSSIDGVYTANWTNGFAAPYRFYNLDNVMTLTGVPGDKTTMHPAPQTPNRYDELEHLVGSMALTDSKEAVQAILTIDISTTPSKAYVSTNVTEISNGVSKVIMQGSNQGPVPKTGDTFEVGLHVDNPEIADFIAHHPGVSDILNEPDFPKDRAIRSAADVSCEINLNPADTGWGSK